MEDGETLFANEIYVNGNRWYLAQDIDGDAPGWSATQAEENELAQRLFGSTPASLDERDRDGTSQIGEPTTTPYKNQPSTVSNAETTVGDYIPDDLRDLDIDETLFNNDPQFLDNGDLDGFSENDSNNGDYSDVDLNEYYTPPPSPTQTSDSATFNITQGSQEYMEQFIRRLPPSVMREQRPHKIVPFNMLPSPHRFDSGISEGSGNYCSLICTFLGCMNLKKITE